MSAEHATVLTPEALHFLATLHRCFNARRLALLAARDARQLRLDTGELPDFLPHTAAVRADPSWRGAPPAPGLVDRRVEITGPVDRKMVINALNCGASTFMADFEDSNAPTWTNSLDGQVNLRDALTRTISFQGAAGGRTYRLKPAEQLATLIVRPRGWHMEEVRSRERGFFSFGIWFFPALPAGRRRRRAPPLPSPAATRHCPASCACPFDDQTTYNHHSFANEQQ